jgi:hypothetical protein
VIAPRLWVDADRRRGLAAAGSLLQSHSANRQHASGEQQLKEPASMMVPGRHEGDGFKPI